MTYLLGKTEVGVYGFSIVKDSLSGPRLVTSWTSNITSPPPPKKHTIVIDLARAWKGGGGQKLFTNFFLVDSGEYLRKIAYTQYGICVVKPLCDVCCGTI